jgi:hypothetical protein
MASLNWSTSREINSKSFVIERSIDGKNWIALGVVNASGNSLSNNKYSFTDYSPARGTNYYRLKRIDTDSTVSYTVVRTISFENSKAVTIFPNPARNFVNVTLPDTPSSSTIEVINIQGKIIYKVITTSNSFI